MGEQLRFPPGEIEASLPTHKCLKYASEIRSILSRNTLGPAEAAKMRGKPGYAQTLLFGRVGRSLLQPFSTMQYDTQANGYTKLSQELEEVIPWWLAQLGRAKPRKVFTRPTHPLLVYTDACGDGRIGVVVVEMGLYRHTIPTPRNGS